MRNRKWIRLLSYVTGSVNQDFLSPLPCLGTPNHVAVIPVNRRLPVIIVPSSAHDMGDKLAALPESTKSSLKIPPLPCIR